MLPSTHRPYFPIYIPFDRGISVLRDVIMDRYGDLYEGGPGPTLLNGVVVGSRRTSVGTCYLDVRGTDGIMYLVRNPADSGEPIAGMGRLDLGFLND